MSRATTNVKWSNSLSERRIIFRAGRDLCALLADIMEEHQDDKFICIHVFQDEMKDFEFIPELSLVAPSMHTADDLHLYYNDVYLRVHYDHLHMDVLVEESKRGKCYGCTFVTYSHIPFSVQVIVREFEKGNDKRIYSKNTGIT